MDVLPQLLTQEMELSRDVKNWFSEIFEAFISKFPQLQEYGIDIKISKVDPETGSGIGTITVFSNDKQITVPIIVRNFKLAPFDVFEYDGQFYPLTFARLMNIFLATNIGAVSAPVKTDQAISQVSIGRELPTGYFAEVKTLSKAGGKISPFRKIAHTVYKQDIENSLELFSKYADGLSIYKLKKNLIGRPDVKDVLASAKKSLEERTFLIKKETENRYLVKVAFSGNSKIDEFFVDSDGFNSCFNFLSNDHKAKIDQGKHLIVSFNKRACHPIVKDIIPAFEVRCPGKYLFPTANGKLIRGYVFKSFTGEWLFWNESYYCLSPSLFGIKECGDIPSKFRNYNIRPGKCYFIRFLPDRVFGPFYIVRISIDKNRNKIKEIFGSFGLYRIKIDLLDDSEEIIAVKKDGNEMKISFSKIIDILPAEVIIDLPKNKTDFETYFNYVFPSLKIEPKLDGGFIISYQSSQIVVDNSPELEFVLRGVFNVASREASKIAKYASVKPSVTLLNVDLPVEKVFIPKEASAKEKIVKYLISEIDFPRLIKYASTIKDTVTLDTIFTLSLMRPHNLFEFIQLVPILKFVASKLAKLLLFVRLGLKNIDEEALSYTMRQL